uniref:Uncharacterized protein n=1 Tax=Arion vulgaris TaxID=1028688 RepID=A0A0B7AM61_9EUPU
MTTNLGYKKTQTRMLTNEHKMYRLALGQNILQRYQNRFEFVGHIVNRDNT